MVTHSLLILGLQNNFSYLYIFLCWYMLVNKHNLDFLFFTYAATALGETNFYIPHIKTSLRGGGGGLKKLTCKEVTKNPRSAPRVTTVFHHQVHPPPHLIPRWFSSTFRCNRPHPSVLYGPPPSHLPHNHCSSPPYLDSVESRIVTRTHLHQLYRYHHHHHCLCRCVFTIHPGQIPA